MKLDIGLTSEYVMIYNSGGVLTIHLIVHPIVNTQHEVESVDASIGKL
jgi:hypothetical protein